MLAPSREPGAPTRRLFFALACPALQRQAIAHWRNSLNLRSGRRIPASQFHLTLLFLGEVELSLLPAVLAAAATIRTPSPRLEVPLDRLDAWRRPGVLFLAPEQAPPSLLRLAYDLEQAMQPLGLMPEHNDYRPHLTLARDYRTPPPEAIVAPDFFITASHFTLFESHKGHYLPVQAWPLG